MCHGTYHILCPLFGQRSKEKEKWPSGKASFFVCLRTEVEVGVGMEGKGNGGEGRYAAERGPSYSH